MASQEKINEIRQTSELKVSETNEFNETKNLKWKTAIPAVKMPMYCVASIPISINMQMP